MFYAIRLANGSYVSGLTDSVQSTTDVSQAKAFLSRDGASGWASLYLPRFEIVLVR
jgi:hypothetical protein